MDLLVSSQPVDPLKMDLLETNPTALDESTIKEYFDAIKNKDIIKIRKLLLTNSKKLTSSTYCDPSITYDPSIDLDAYGFLGAYLGPLTGPQMALLLGNELIALELIDASFIDDLNITFGGNNSLLHLAVLLKEKEIIKCLLDRKVNINIINTKGYKPVDLANDPSIIELFQSL